LFRRTKPAAAADQPSHDKSRPMAIGRGPATPPSSDPLAASLIYLAAYHGRAISREALLGGLPVLDGRLSVALYDRAARRAGLETEAIRRDLPDIPALVLPAVLIMKNGTTLILLGFDETGGIVSALDPSIQPYTPQSTPLEAIATGFTGYAFLVRAAAETDARAVAAGSLPRDHWFWSVVKAHWRNYGHIALSALLINILALAMPLFTMSVYDRVIPNGAIPSLVALSIGMGLAIAFDLILRMVRSKMIDVTGKTIDVVLAANIFEHVMGVKMRFCSSPYCS
jgi:ATP-binding cassette, subfamily C, bacterial LapB